MAVINTNVKGLYSQLSLRNTERKQSAAMQQLSTGKRINSSRDDAAGMAIASRMTSQIRSLNQAVRNAGDAISLIQTAEGATDEITDMLARMRELAIQSINDTNANEQRSYLDLEFQQLKQEIVRVADTTEWNGFPVLNGSAGARVGEMPIFKATSENQFGQVTISPTTVRTLDGLGAGEIQQITIPDASTTETVTVKLPPLSAGQTVTVGSLQFTANIDITSAQLAGAFSGLHAGDITNADVTINATSYGTFSGSLVGFNSVLKVGDATSVVFTAATPQTQVNDLGIAGPSSSISKTINGTTTDTETTDVNFVALTKGQFVTVAGLTFTAKVASVAAADVAAAFSGLIDGAVTGSQVANGDYSGTFAGFTSGSVINTNVIKFTNATANSNTTDLPVSTGPTVTTPVTVGTVQGTGVSGVGGSTAEVTTVTFEDLRPGEKVRVGGLTFTALEPSVGGAVVLADQVAAAFRAATTGNITDGATPAVTIGTLAGTANTGWARTGATNQAIYTKSPTGDVPDLGVSNIAPTVINFSKTDGVSPFDTGTIKVAGVNIRIEPLDTVTSTTLARKIQSALIGTNQFGSGSGRNVTASAGVVTINFGAGEGDVPNTVVDLSAITSKTAVVATTRSAVTQSVETFLGSGGFVTGGSLAMDVSSAGDVFASFTNPTGEVIPMNGVLNNKAVNETADVRFNNLSAGQSVTVAGLTFTALTDRTAAQVATAFKSIVDGGGGTSDANGRFSGKLYAFRSGGSNPLTNIAIQGSGTVHETNKIKFSEMSPGESISVGGLIFTASTYASSEDVATVFANRPSAFAGAGATVNGASGTAVGNLTGTLLANWSSGAVGASGDELTFTNSTFANVTNLVTVSNRADNAVRFSSTTSGNNVRDIVLTSTGILPSWSLRQGAPAGSISFYKNVGANTRVITDDLNYVYKDSVGSVINLNDRAFKTAVGVEGSIPALRPGDLKINGIDIGGSYAMDDPFSPLNNAAGSAIAKAAAINRKAIVAGITRGETQSISLSGSPQPGALTVGGVSVNLNAADLLPSQAAAKIAEAMRASLLYAPDTGRSITYTPGNSVVYVNFAPKEGNMPDLTVLPGSTGLTAIVDTTSEAFASSDGTGVFAKVNQNIMTGSGMTGSAIVRGVVNINGFTSAEFTTVMSSTSQSRINVVRAINMISEKTGVKAIDTGSDSKGVTLIAADGRNIEVNFESESNNDEFSTRTGLRLGVQSGTYSLESKIASPIVLTCDTFGDIKRAGIAQGNFSRNQATVNTSDRQMVDPPLPQVTSMIVGGTVNGVGTYSATINGTTFINASAPANEMAARDELLALINANKDLGVTAKAGNTKGELFLTAVTPGTSFTFTASKSGNATGTVTQSEMQPAILTQYKALGMDDLVINGIAIPMSTSADDTYSNTVVASSIPSASGIAIANSINKQTVNSGVRAEANPAVIQGRFTETALPILSVPTMQSLFVNGVEIKVEFIQGETSENRRSKVVDAINVRTGQHGVKASDNGQGVTLSSDGRNVSVWFDSNVKDLKASNFGLSSGGEVAQVSRIKVGGSTVLTTDTASVVINGVKITSAQAGTATATALAGALETAINQALSLGSIKNLKVVRTNDSIDVISTIPGTSFDLVGASASGDSTLSISALKANGFGESYVTGVKDATSADASIKRLAASQARTLYSTVRLIAEAPQLPDLPKPIGAPPSDLEKLLQSNSKPFTVTAGPSGFSENSNFRALGFHEGTYGGRASSDLDPPRVGRMAFQVGASANQLITIDLADFGSGGTITGDLTGDVDLNVESRTTRINTQAGASSVLAKLDSVMDHVNATRATMGAVMNRLDHVINNLSNVSMNLSASRSQIEDADYATASTELAKTQIMQQAATAVLAQANTSQQSVLKLLQG